MDTISRFERIGYPAIAWLLAGGQRSLVPVSLIITNVVALCALGFGGGLLARNSGRHAMWGLVLAGYWGYLWSAGRDLTEITAAAFLLLGLYAYRRERSLLAGVLLLGAVLTKETALYVVLVIAATRIVRWLTRRDPRPLGSTDITWGLPLIGFAVWQVAVLTATGTLPLGASGQANLGQPFVGLGDGLRHFLSHPFHVASLLWIGELTVLVAIVIAAGVSVRASSAPLHERLAWWQSCSSPSAFHHRSGEATSGSGASMTSTSSVGSSCSERPDGCGRWRQWPEEPGSSSRLN
jgi:hypothetical protein